MISGTIHSTIQRIDHFKLTKGSPSPINNDTTPAVHVLQCLAGSIDSRGREAPSTIYAGSLG